MEGPVITESEVWKVGSGTSSGIKTDDRNVEYSPLMNNSPSEDNLSKAPENQESIIQKVTCSNIPDLTSKLMSDQIKSAIQNELQIQDDSIQSVSMSDATPSDETCKEDICINHAEDKCKSGPQSPDQEITILVTNHDCTIEEEEDDGDEVFGSQKPCVPIDPKSSKEMKDEGDFVEGSIVVANVIEVSQIHKTSVLRSTPTEEKSNNSLSTEEEPSLPGRQEASSNEQTPESHNSSSPSRKTDTQATNLTKEEDDPKVQLKQAESKQFLQDKMSLTRSPGHQQHVQTQVSLEVMFHSVATSPMTPPEGSAAFLFPSNFGKLANKSLAEEAQNIETQDVEMQAGLQVEYRSVATAPMTPVVLTAPELIPEPEPRLGVPIEDVAEPVQEVSWDEKGMTWEVYGAVVEVAVLGTAIQKHLEKQVKKQKQQPSPLSTLTDAVEPSDQAETEAIQGPPMPSSPPPISDPIDCNLTKPQSEEKIDQSGKARRHAFRKWFRNVRRPSCCRKRRQEE